MLAVYVGYGYYYYQYLLPGQGDISQLCNYKSIFPALLPVRAVPIPGDRTGGRKAQQFKMFLFICAIK